MTSDHRCADDHAVHDCCVYGDIFSELRKYYRFAGNEPSSINVVRFRVFGNPSSHSELSMISSLKVSTSYSTVYSVLRCNVRAIPDIGLDLITPMSPVMVSRSLGARMIFQDTGTMTIALDLLTSRSPYEQLQIVAEDYADRIAFVGNIDVVFESSIRVVRIESVHKIGLLVELAFALLPVYDSYGVAIDALVNTVPMYPIGLWRSDRMIHAIRVMVSVERKRVQRIRKGRNVVLCRIVGFVNGLNMLLGRVSKVRLFQLDGVLRCLTKTRVMHSHILISARTGSYYSAEIKGSTGFLGSWFSDRMVCRLRVRLFYAYTGPRAPDSALYEFPVYGIIPIFELGYNEKRELYGKRKSVRLELYVESRSNIFGDCVEYREVDRFSNLTFVEFPAPITAWKIPNLNLSAQNIPTLNTVKLRFSSSSDMVLGEQLVRNPFVIEMEPMSIKSPIPRLACAMYDVEGKIYLQFDAKESSFTGDIWVSIHVRGIFDVYGSRPYGGGTVVERTVFVNVTSDRYRTGSLFAFAEDDVLVSRVPERGEEFVCNVIVKESLSSLQQRHHVGVLYYEPLVHPLDKVLLHTSRSISGAESTLSYRQSIEFARYRQYIHIILVVDIVGSSYNVNCVLPNGPSLEIELVGNDTYVYVQSLIFRSSVRYPRMSGRVIFFVECSPFDYPVVRVYGFESRALIGHLAVVREEHANGASDLPHAQLQMTHITVLELRVESKERIPTPPHVEMFYLFYETIGRWVNDIRIRVCTSSSLLSYARTYSWYANARMGQLKARASMVSSAFVFIHPAQYAKSRIRMDNVLSGYNKIAKKGEVPKVHDIALRICSSRVISVPKMTGQYSKDKGTVSTIDIVQYLYRARGANDVVYRVRSYAAASPLAGEFARVELLLMLGAQIEYGESSFIFGLVVAISPFSNKIIRIDDPRNIFVANGDMGSFVLVDHKVPLNEYAYRKRTNVYENIYPSGIWRSDRMISKIIRVHTEISVTSRNASVFKVLESGLKDTRVSISAYTKRSIHGATVSDAWRVGVFAYGYRVWRDNPIRTQPMGYHFVAVMSVRHQYQNRIYFSLVEELLPLLSGALLINSDHSWLRLRSPLKHRNMEMSFKYDGVYKAQPYSDIYQRVTWKDISHNPRIEILSNESVLRDVRVVSTPRVVRSFDHRLFRLSYMVHAKPKSMISRTRLFSNRRVTQRMFQSWKIFTFQSAEPLASDVYYARLWEKKAIQVSTDGARVVGHAYFYISKHEGNRLVRLSSKLSTVEMDTLSVVPYDMNVVLPTFDDSIESSSLFRRVFISGSHASDRMVSRVYIVSFANGSSVKRILSAASPVDASASKSSFSVFSTNTLSVTDAHLRVASGASRALAKTCLLNRFGLVIKSVCSGSMRAYRNTATIGTALLSYLRKQKESSRNVVCAEPFFRYTQFVRGGELVFAHMSSTQVITGQLCMKTVRTYKPQIPFNLRYGNPWRYGVVSEYGLYTSFYVDAGTYYPSVSDVLPIRTSRLCEAEGYELSLFVDHSATRRSELVMLRVACAVRRVPTQYKLALVHTVRLMPFGINGIDDPYALVAVRDDDDDPNTHPYFSMSSTSHGVELYANVQGKRIYLRYHPINMVTGTFRSVSYKLFEAAWVDARRLRSVNRISTYTGVSSRARRNAVTRVNRRVYLRYCSRDRIDVYSKVMLIGRKSVFLYESDVLKRSRRAARCVHVPETAYGFPIRGRFMLRIVPSYSEYPSQVLAAFDEQLQSYSIDAFDREEAVFVARLSRSGVELWTIVLGNQYPVMGIDTYTEDMGALPFVFKTVPSGYLCVSEGTLQAQLSFMIRRVRVLIGNRFNSTVSCYERRKITYTQIRSEMKTASIGLWHGVLDGRTRMLPTWMSDLRRVTVSAVRGIVVSSMKTRRMVGSSVRLKNHMWKFEKRGSIDVRALASRTEAFGFPLHRRFYLRFHVGIRSNLDVISQDGVNDKIPPTHGFHYTNGFMKIFELSSSSLYTEQLFEACMRRGGEIALRVCGTVDKFYSRLSVVDGKSSADSMELREIDYDNKRILVANNSYFMVLPRTMYNVQFKLQTDIGNRIVAKVNVAFEDDAPVVDRLHSVKLFHYLLHYTRKTRLISYVHAIDYVSSVVKNVSSPRLGESAFGFILNQPFLIRRFITADSAYVDVERVYRSVDYAIRYKYAREGLRIVEQGDRVTMESFDLYDPFIREALFIAQLCIHLKGVRLWVFNETKTEIHPLVNLNRTDSSGLYSEEYYNTFRINELEGSMVISTEESTYTLSASVSNRRITYEEDGRIRIASNGEREAKFVVREAFDTKCVLLQETTSGRYLVCKKDIVALIVARHVPILRVDGTNYSGKDALSGTEFRILGSNLVGDSEGLLMNGEGALRTPMKCPSLDDVFEVMVEMNVKRSAAPIVGTAHHDTSVFAWGGNAQFLRMGYNNGNNLQIIFMGLLLYEWLWNDINENRIVVVVRRVRKGVVVKLFRNNSKVYDTLIDDDSNNFNNFKLINKKLSKADSDVNIYIGARKDSMSYAKDIYLKDLRIYFGQFRLEEYYEIPNGTLVVKEESLDDLLTVNPISNIYPSFDYTVLIVLKRQTIMTSSPWESVFSWFKTRSSSVNNAFLRFGHLGEYPSNLQISVMGAVTDLPWLWLEEDSGRYLVVIHVTRTGSSDVRQTFTVYDDMYATTPLVDLEYDISSRRLSDSLYEADVLEIGHPNKNVFEFRLYQNLTDGLQTIVRDMCLSHLDSKYDMLFDISEDNLRSRGSDRSLHAYADGRMTLADQRTSSLQRIDLNVCLPDSYVAVPKNTVVPSLHQLRRVSVLKSDVINTRVRMHSVFSTSMRVAVGSSAVGSTLRKIFVNKLLTNLVLLVDGYKPFYNIAVTMLEDYSRVVRRSSALQIVSSVYEEVIPYTNFNSFDIYVFAVVVMPVHDSIVYPVTLLNVWNTTDGNSLLLLSVYQYTVNNNQNKWRLEIQINAEKQFYKDLSYADHYSRIRDDFSTQDKKLHTRVPTLFMVHLYDDNGYLHARIRADVLNKNYILMNVSTTIASSDLNSKSLRLNLNPYDNTLSVPQLSELRMYFSRKITLEDSIMSEIRTKWSTSVVVMVHRVVLYTHDTKIQSTQIRATQYPRVSVKTRCVNREMEAKYAVKRISERYDFISSYTNTMNVYTRSVTNYLSRGVTVKALSKEVCSIDTIVYNRPSVNPITRCIDFSTYAGFVLNKFLPIFIGGTVVEDGSIMMYNVGHNLGKLFAKNAFEPEDYFMAIVGLHGGVHLLTIDNATVKGVRVVNQPTKYVMLTNIEKHYSSFIKNDTNILNAKDNYMLRIKMDKDIVFDKANSAIKYIATTMAKTSISVKVRVHTSFPFIAFEKLAFTTHEDYKPFSNKFVRLVYVPEWLDGTNALRTGIGYRSDSSFTPYTTSSSSPYNYYTYRQTQNSYPFNTEINSYAGETTPIVYMKGNSYQRYEGSSSFVKPPDMPFLVLADGGVGKRFLNYRPPPFYYKNFRMTMLISWCYFNRDKAPVFFDGAGTPASENLYDPSSHWIPYALRPGEYQWIRLLGWGTYGLGYLSLYVNHGRIKIAVIGSIVSSPTHALVGYTTNSYFRTGFSIVDVTDNSDGTYTLSYVICTYKYACSDNSMESEYESLGVITLSKTDIDAYYNTADQTIYTHTGAFTCAYESARTSHHAGPICVSSFSCSTIGLDATELYRHTRDQN